MAVMGAKKQALGRTWALKNKQREAALKKGEKKEEKVDPEEHKKRLEKLKSLGLIK
ncbi:hypothetical protein ACFLZZ_01075 [Nanoarchaeota archaeon]